MMKQTMEESVRIYPWGVRERGYFVGWHIFQGAHKGIGVAAEYLKGNRSKLTAN